MLNRSVTKIYFFSILITLFIIQSCKKDTIGSSFSKSLTWTNPVCEPAVDSTLVPNVPAVIIEEGSQFKYPSFNPNNQYEIVYFEQEADSGSTPSEIGKLVKYNYQSGTKECCCYLWCCYL